MPKQLLKITQFHGGLNSNSDPRDIAEGELSEATDIMVDELGKIRMMGGIAQHYNYTNSANNPNNSAVVNPGYGLFQFSHDRTEGESVGTASPETGDDYLVMADTTTTANIDIYSRVTNTWGLQKIDLGSITGMKPAFYAVDGVLRVSDGNFSANINKWYGYIERTHFNGLTPGGSADNYDGWFSKDQEIKAPTRGLYSATNDGVYGTTTDGDATTLTDTGAFDGFTAAQIDGIGYIAVNTTDNSSAVVEERDNDNSLGTASTDDWYNGGASIYRIYPPAGTGFNILIHQVASAASTWEDGYYEIATTFIYDGNQESLPFENPGNTVGLSPSLYAQVGVFATSPYDPRITGGNVYYRIGGSGDDWKLIAEISLYHGVRTTYDNSWTAWTLDDDTGVCCFAISNAVQQDLATTYQLLSGVSQDSNTLYAQYKTAAIANRMAYIGNIQTKNNDNKDQVMGDTVIKTPVNKFDVFSLDRRLEASINDGDNIVKLETYADRLLIFKKNKMELLNISQEVEFLEDTFIHKGVSHPAATCKTDFGIAWVNKQGCYLYDGQKVNNLLEKKGVQIIKESDWATFTTNEPMIGYIPKKRQLLVVDDNSATGVGKTFLYDLVTQSWVKGADGTLTSQALTNFVTDWNGDLVYAYTSAIVKWDDAADTSTDMVMSTKDIDFGQPGQKKTVYKVIVTYQSGGATTHVQVDYGVDGDTAFTHDFTVPELPSASGWQVAELIPDTLSQSSNIKSFRLRFATDSTVPAAFEINDVSIVYRLKGMR